MKLISRTEKILRFGLVAVQVIAVAAAVIETYKKLNQRSNSFRSNRSTENKRDVVDEASWGSFPASDPPSWIRAKV